MDFVMAWVDGNDPAWQKEKRKTEHVPEATAETSATGTGIIYSTGFAVWNSLHPGYGKFILSPGGISPNG